MTLSMNELIALQQSKITSGEISSSQELIDFMASQSMNVDVIDPSKKVSLTYSGSLLDGTSTNSIATKIADSHANVVVIDNTAVGQLLADADDTNPFYNSLDTFIEQDLISQGITPSDTLVTSERSKLMFGVSENGARIEQGLWDRVSTNYLNDNTGEVRAIIGTSSYRDANNNLVINSNESVFTQTELKNILDDPSRSGINGISREAMVTKFNDILADGGSEADALIALRQDIQLDSETRFTSYIEYTKDANGNITSVATHQEVWYGTDIEAKPYNFDVPDKESGFSAFVKNADITILNATTAGLESLSKLGVAGDVASLAITFAKAEERYAAGDVDGAKEIIGDWATETSDGWTGYNALDVNDFKYYRINHSKLFADKKNHINGIENFWNQAKRHMRKFNGIPKHHFELFLKECEWRFNTPEPKAQLKQIKQWVK